MCFESSKEPSHRDGSFEDPQHMFWMRNEENSFPIHTYIWKPVTDKTVCVSSMIKGEISCDSTVDCRL